MPALVEVVRNDPDLSTRLAAVSGLGAIGPEANAAVPVLKVAQQEKPLESAAMSALKKIEQ